MKGLVALALFDPRLYLLAWLGAGVVYLLWRVLRRERRMPGYVGFVVGRIGVAGTAVKPTKTRNTSACCIA